MVKKTFFLVQVLSRAKETGRSIAPELSFRATRLASLAFSHSAGSPSPPSLGWGRLISRDLSARRGGGEGQTGAVEARESGVSFD